MSILEAISPMARELLSGAESTDGAQGTDRPTPPPRKTEGRMNITRARGKRKFRVHAMADGRPACGGGCEGRSAQWQEVLLRVDCRACAKILHLALAEQKERKYEDDKGV